MRLIKKTVINEISEYQTNLRKLLLNKLIEGGIASLSSISSLLLGINNNEKAYDAAIRELREETGLYPTKIWTIDQVNNYYDPKYDKVFLIPVFGAEVNKKDIELSSEHTDHYWGSVESVKKKMLWNQQKLGLENFYQMLTNNTKKLELSKITI